MLIDVKEVTLADLYAYNAFGIEFVIEDGEITDAQPAD